VDLKGGKRKERKGEEWKNDERILRDPAQNDNFFFPLVRQEKKRKGGGKGGETFNMFYGENLLEREKKGKNQKKTVNILRKRAYSFTLGGKKKRKKGGKEDAHITQTFHNLQPKPEESCDHQEETSGGHCQEKKKNGEGKKLEHWNILRKDHPFSTSTGPS